MTLAKNLRATYMDAQPFPYIAIPNFLPADVANRCAAEFPGVRDIDWVFAGPGRTRHSGDPNVEKLSTSREELYPPMIRRVMHEFNSSTFLDFVSELTGHKRLVTDPWFASCGLNSTGRGGRLMVHADGDRHPNGDFYQLLNMIYYVTPDWQESWGGALELWDRKAEKMVTSVKNDFNTMVIFFTGSKSFHGHPHPLTCPDGVRRNSLAVYYYTTRRPKDEEYGGRNTSVNWQQTNTLDSRQELGARLKTTAQKLLPEAVIRKAKGVVKALKS